MNEQLLQFIWQFQYFDKNELLTTAGEQIRIDKPGRHNHDQGPDFNDAMIRIDSTRWAGTVELHLKSSDWNKHGHHTDSNYDNVILHVVWEDDLAVGSVPVLELKNRIPLSLIQRYEQLTYTTDFIPCKNLIRTVPELVWIAWKERLAVERLCRKSAEIQSMLETCNWHWEEGFWWRLARGFGMKVNAEAFEAVAKSLSTRIISRHRNQLIQLEALLFGQAGFLRGRYRDAYPRALQKEYRHLQKKYGLKPVQQPFHMLRMRPVNFPHIRLAQLAMLLYQSSHLFATARDDDNLDKIKNLLDCGTSEYWNTHYHFDELSTYKLKKTGRMLADSQIINCIAPIIFAYGQFHQDISLQEKALSWLTKTTEEDNRITRSFGEAGVLASNACESQALLELRNEYCLHRRCLECAAGNSMLSVNQLQNS